MWDAIQGLPDDLIQICRDRLKAGAEKYGLSWNEVDLRQDLLEEVEDSINYITFIAARLADQEILNEDLTEIISRLRFHAYATWSLASGLPAFEGPTSNEWVAQQREPAVAPI